MTRPLPTAAAAARSSTPREKSSASTPPTWTAFLAGISASPLKLCDLCCRKQKNRSSGSFSPLSKLSIPLQHIPLRNHTFQPAEIGAAHHRHQRPAIHVAQRSLQRMIGMHIRNSSLIQQRTQSDATLLGIRNRTQLMPCDAAPVILVQSYQHTVGA